MPLHAAPADRLRHARQRLKRLRDWPGHAGNAYSPIVCIGLLLIVALGFNIR